MAALFEYKAVHVASKNYTWAISTINWAISTINMSYPEFVPFMRVWLDDTFFRLLQLLLLVHRRSIRLFQVIIL